MSSIKLAFFTSFDTRPRSLQVEIVYLSKRIPKKNLSYAAEDLLAFSSKEVSRYRPQKPSYSKLPYSGTSLLPSDNLQRNSRLDSE